MTTVHGLPADTAHAKWIPPFEALLKKTYGIKVRWAQLNGDAPASAGAHKHGAFDLTVSDPGSRSVDAAYKIVVKVARSMGADATWERPYNWDRRKGMRHIHGILTGAPGLAQIAKNQITAVWANRNGLADNGKDTGPRPLSGRTYLEGIAWANAQLTPFTLRLGTWNLPADDKLDDPAARIKRAAAIIKTSNLAVVGWNELQGIRSAGVPSEFARDLDAALGSNWKLVKPTRALNENYISFDSNRVTLVHQYTDSILPAPTGGRHITRAVFKDNATGQLFAVGQAHYVNGTTPAHERDRAAQAARSVYVMKAVRDKHEKCPIVVMGDFNTDEILPAFAKWKRTREYADTSTTRNAATYTNKDKDKPSTNPAWAIDQIEVTADLYVIGYSVVLDVDAKGLFKQPRPSDHQLVIVSLKNA